MWNSCLVMCETEMKNASSVSFFFKHFWFLSSIFNQRYQNISLTSPWETEFPTHYVVNSLAKSVWTGCSHLLMRGSSPYALGDYWLYCVNWDVSEMKEGTRENWIRITGIIWDSLRQLGHPVTMLLSRDRFMES